ncbi:aminoacyl-tRNA hydrolase [Tuwongella immobilis]|uniref:Peptidyl-tRNA hydrolase n=1 Tax=Tuwongella immobilis TaxID=692036 RepID=A0A6C2YT69_9BACT|nr:aminoacyl-tRNA hydrolase [Tuwongella immobilis]VIP04910.1 peptidyl-trna hydrolase : Peptidyl-tRNA hydrolase OS=Isosphaera pallida (strain ATCC 43644 / DSM 9630 / IS1B) GN=pth PE=3 SV=1: Pept_tRNA_hydro [Tuwongella immobilis]VTS07179.1 peptidyl-trna hydrolase : Peptidyl-tRNA hydrolase OS=Isosphaera pallida (strain ATCC 43644 / DSM 9630 / IS1B) GN=pth PE=3 SV=1: Pept_tRNA_hydro [Tuwongella immobilis]
MKVVVGLGNPGAKYAGTRHNVGFDVIDYLAQASAGAFRSRFQSQVLEIIEGSETLLLVKPETFMNLSGRAVRQILDFYKLTPESLLVLCDDLSLPLGKLRARAQGTHGGQNGLRNIQEQLGTIEYPRLRIGIGDRGMIDAAEFVLSRFRAAEKGLIEDSIAQAAQGVLVWARDGIEACMNRVNGAGSSEPKKPRSDSAPKRSAAKPTEGSHPEPSSGGEASKPG